MSHTSFTGSSISWQDNVTNTEIRLRADLPSFHTMVRQASCAVYGTLRHMDAGRIYNDILCGKMTSKKENNGRAKLQYKDVKGT